VEVAVFVTRKSDSEDLIVHRSPVQGGYWHVVAGGVEAGESVAEAAERELHEETGLVARVTSGVEVTSTSTAYRGACRASRPVRPVGQAGGSDLLSRVRARHDDHRWCDPGEAFSVLRWPATAQALRQLVSGQPG
jgi:8-oxo-dGTP pyrophosphatase MutT (NUDIX family)